MLPAQLIPYAVNCTSNKDSIFGCDISSNDCINLPLGLYGELKLSPIGRNQILHKNRELIISLNESSKTDISLYDSRKDGYGLLNGGISQINNVPIHLPLAVCPKCQSAQFQLHFDFEYPEFSELSTLEILRPDNAFIWIWISMRCSHCHSVFRCNFETD